MPTRFTRPLAVALALAALAGAGIVLGTPESAIANTPPSAFTFEICLECNFECDGNEHSVDSQEVVDTWDMYWRKRDPEGPYNQAHDCTSAASCFEHHPTVCVDAEAPFDAGNQTELWATLSSADAETLTRALSAYPAHLHLNVERNAVQMSGCQGQIVMHVPLPRGVVEEVAENIAASDPNHPAE